MNEEFKIFLKIRPFISTKLLHCYVCFYQKVKTNQSLSVPIVPLRMSLGKWQIIDNIIDDQRKRKHSLRVIINAIFSLNNTGSQWRNAAQLNLDSNYPP